MFLRDVGATMRGEMNADRLSGIVTCLEKIAEMDRRIIDPNAHHVNLPSERLDAYGERFEERLKLIRELEVMLSEKPEAQ
jgi:hypothetical protein